MTVALEAGLVGRDQQTLCAFYTRVMGFALVDRLEFDVGTVCKFRRDAARLKIFFRVDAVDPVVDDRALVPTRRLAIRGAQPRQLDDVDELAAAVPPRTDACSSRRRTIGGLGWPGLRPRREHVGAARRSPRHEGPRP